MLPYSKVPFNKKILLHQQKNRMSSELMEMSATAATTGTTTIVTNQQPCWHCNMVQYSGRYEKMASYYNHF